MFVGYLKWRQENIARKQRTIRRDVVRDELLIIRKMFLYAKKEHLCAEKSVPTWDLAVERAASKRERITAANLNDFLNVAHAWAILEALSGKGVPSF